jgi:hypothetical protein
MTLDDAIRELRQRGEAVPKPSRLPTSGEIDAMERHLGVTFHSDYRKFLAEASDVVLGTLEPATITEPHSHTYLPDVIESARTIGVPEDLTPICDDNGNFYCLTQGGAVHFWSHDGSTNERWPSLAEWIDKVWINERA